LKAVPKDGLELTAENNFLKEGYMTCLLKSFLKEGCMTCLLKSFLKEGCMTCLEHCNSVTMFVATVLYRI
jgi:hypothetical protein